MAAAPAIVRGPMARASAHSGPADEGSKPKGRGRRLPPRPCPLCRKEVRFTWQCRCGFEMCQGCMDENLWGVTCNNVTWVCPDCGEPNSY